MTKEERRKKLIPPKMDVQLNRVAMFFFVNALKTEFIKKNIKWIWRDFGDRGCVDIIAKEGEAWIAPEISLKDTFDAHISVYLSNGVPPKAKVKIEEKEVVCDEVAFERIDPENKEWTLLDKDLIYYLNRLSSRNLTRVLGAEPSISQAEWEGDETDFCTRIQLRFYAKGENHKNYENYVKIRREADHRFINKQLGIFDFDSLGGVGFPFWLEDGTTIKNKIKHFLQSKDRAYGLQEVETPAFGSRKLYETSGHWDHYRDTMFNPVKVDHDEIIMRPMTCPHHIILYKKQRRSYKELPIRYCEHAQLYRYEKSGALTGLERVRSMELTDAHLFVRPDQIKQEVKTSYQVIQEVLKVFDIEIDSVDLSLHDPKEKEKFFDDPDMWAESEKTLRETLKDLKVKFKEEVGEAAFYGPKLDIQVKTVLGKVITLSTIQLDFLLPQRFDLTYIDKNDGGDENYAPKQRPVLIHRGLIGTYERFMAILLEQTGGLIPFPFAARQVKIIPIKIDDNKQVEYAKQVASQLFNNDFSAKIDYTDERLGKKMRNAQTEKWYYQIVIGDQEVDKHEINVREYGQKQSKNMTIDEFIKVLKTREKKALNR